MVEQSPSVRRENADVNFVPQFEMPSDEEEEEEEPEKQQEEEAEVPPEQQSPSSLQSPFSAPAQPQLSPVITSRYPTRARRPPSRLQMDPQQKSYVLNKANLIVYDNQSQTGELETVFTGELFAGVAVSGVKGPHNYSGAMASPENEQWLEAIAEETRSLLQKGVYEDVDEGKIKMKRKPLTTRWVLSMKVNSADNTIKRFKARVVICGFEQLEGLDFDKIFAPTVSHSTVRTFLAHAAASGMEVHHVDVKTAFLNSDVDRELYCSPPDRLKDGRKVW